ncbi:MAG: hypothetical protein KAG97_08730, partial [Victivallales bacterium]|nr:hypothetical protein [Victivallales bacterium]
LAKNDSASGEEFYGFQKRVADIVWKTRPDIQFYTQTKGKSYYRPPTMIELGPRFTVAQLVPRVNPKSDFDFYVKLAGEWKGNSVKTILKSYPRYDVNTYMDYPIMTPYYTVDYLRKFADVVEGADNSELYFKIPYSFSALGQYVQMKALFDISAPAGKWVERFCSLVYPGASGTMVEFYKSMDDLYRMRSSSLGDPLLDAYYPDNLNKPMALLDAAAKKIDKSHSRWFDDLYCDFKKFHAYCQSQKKRVDALRKAVDKKFEVPFTEKNCSLDIPPDSWKGALEESFMTPENYVDFQKSKVLFACSKRFLFIGLVACEKSPGRLKSECGTMGEGAIWSDDCFEIMLMPEPDSVSYYQIVCNSRGVFRVLKCGRKSKEMKDLKLCVRAMVGKTKWSVALAVPLDQFPKRAFSGTWRFDAFRSRYLKERKSEDHQISGISLLSRSYHNVNEYVKLTWPELLRR